MPSTEIPHDDHHESGSSLASTPPHRRYMQFFDERLFPHSISSDSSIEIDPDLENILNIEPLPIHPHYIPIVLPVEPTFEELLRRVAGRDDLENVESLKLRVISYMVSLQRLAIFMPKLTSLNLEGSVIGSLRDLGYGLIELKYLNVSNCGLRSLDGTNGIATVETLVADNNMIENVGPCCNLTELKMLSLKENKVRDMGIVSFLGMCTKLKVLNLKDNPVTSSPSYRQNIKKYIKTLELLDDTSFEGPISDHCEEECAVEAHLSSTSSLESTSSLSSHEDSEYDLEPIDTNQLPSTSQDTLQPNWNEPSPTTDGKTIRGTILNKARKRRKHQLNASRLSLASTSSSSSCEVKFPEKLPQDNVELELGVIGSSPEDNVSIGSEVSVDSLQNIINKWKLECERKMEKRCET